MDDFIIAKKKESAPILDLSKTVANSKEEFRRLLEKVPDFKIRADKVPPESIKIKEKNFKFKSGKKDMKVIKEKYAFMDPLPLEMQHLKIAELAAVSIDWKMLTTQRPKSKIEENYFSRLVELGKLENKSRAQEKRQFQMDPQIRKTKNKAGVVETRVVSCHECGEDFCNGKVCTKFGYDSFARIAEAPKISEKVVFSESGSKTRRKIKRQSRSKSKSKNKGRKKSASPSKKTETKRSQNRKSSSKSPTKRKSSRGRKSKK